MKDTEKICYNMFMNIIVEGSVFDEKATGVARFQGNILKVWTALYKQHRFYLVRRTNSLNAFNSNYLCQDIILPWISKRNLLWQQLMLSRMINKVQEAVYFAPNYTLPLGLSIPSVLVIHDASFFRYRQFGHLKNMLLKVIIKLSFRRTNACVVVSQFVKDELIALFGSQAASKIHVVYNACDTRFLTSSCTEYISAVKQKYGLQNRYLFNAGLMFSRRHPEVLLQAFRDLLSRKGEDFILLLVGENRTVPHCDILKLCTDLGIADKVIWIPFVSEDELKALYDGCYAFIYLSDYEGFGLPVLEAIASGKIVVCSGIKVFRELFEGACHFIDDMRPSLLADTIIKAVNEPLPSEQLNKCLAKYSWELSGKKTMQLMERAFQNGEVIGK